MLSIHPSLVCKQYDYILCLSRLRLYVPSLHLLTLACSWIRSWRAGTAWSLLNPNALKFVFPNCWQSLAFTTSRETNLPFSDRDVMISSAALLTSWREQFSLVLGVLVLIIWRAWSMDFPKGSGVPTSLTREAFSCGEEWTSALLLALPISFIDLSYPTGGIDGPSFALFSPRPCCWSIISRREGLGCVIPLAPAIVGGATWITRPIHKEVEKEHLDKEDKIIRKNTCFKFRYCCG